MSLSHEKYFPLDLDSISDVGLETWQKNFYWPISWIDFLEIEEKLTGILDTDIQEYQGHPIADLLLINYKIYLEYSNFIHELIVLKDIKRKGLLPVFKSSERYRAIFNNGIPGKCLVAAPTLNGAGRLKSMLQSMRLTCELLRHRLWPKVIGPQAYITDSSLNDTTLKYLKKNSVGGIKPRPFLTWAKVRATIPEHEASKIKEFCESLVKRVAGVASAYEIIFDEEQIRYLYETTVAIFLAAYELLLRVQATLNGNAGGHLFLGSNNNALSRILSVALRKRGGKVSAFSHGEPLVYQWKKIAWMELSLVDEYIEYSDALAGVLRQTTQVFPPPNKNHPEIIGGYFSPLKAIRIREQDKPSPLNIERVMLIGNAYKETGLSCVTCFPAPVQFDLELRLIKYLQQVGYKVVYKKHPGGVLKGNDFEFLSLGAEVLDGAFEENLDRADAYFFYYTRTSTLGPALCTNKPIFIVDGGWEKIPRKLRSVLEKRCTFVKCAFSDRNTLKFDESAFQGLNNEIEKAQNSDFADTYLF